MRASPHRWLLSFLCGCSLIPNQAAGQEAYRQILPAAVCIRAGDHWGGGCIVDRDRRLLVTSHRLTGDAATVFVAFPTYRGGKLLTSAADYAERFDHLGKVVDADPAHDLALVQLLALPKNATAMALASRSPQTGETLFAVGNAGERGLLWIQASSKVRQTVRRRWQWHAGRGLFDHQAALLEMETPFDNLGWGAPLVTEKGELAGMFSWSQAWNERGEPAPPITFGIDVADIQAFLKEAPRVLEPKNAADRTLRGQHLLRRQLYDAALDEFAAVLSQDPKQAAVYRRRALASYEKGDFNAALADLDQAQKLEPNEPSACVLRGRVYGRKNALDEAIAEFDKAIQLQAKDARAYFFRGLAYHRKGDAARALEDYDRALNVDPADAGALIHRGDWYRTHNQLDKAVADYRQALRVQPTPLAFVRPAELAFDQGNRDEARRLCTTLIERFDPDDPASYVLRGRTLAAQGQREDAIADHTRAVSLDPRQVSAYRLRAALLEQKGDSRRARADLAQAAKIEKVLESPYRAFARRFLKVANETDEPIRVHVQYETLTVMGTWHWYPGPVGSDTDLQADVGPKQSMYLFDDDFKVKARRMRIWAEGKTSSRRFDADRERDVWLCAKEYVANVEEDYVYRIAR